MDALDRLNLHLGPFEGKLDVLAVAADGKRDQGILRPGDRVHTLVERIALDGLAVHLRDDVAGHDPRAVGRRVLERRDDLNLVRTVLDDRDTDADKVPSSVLVELIGIQRPDDGRKLVQRFECSAHQFTDDQLFRQAHGLRVDVTDHSAEMPAGIFPGER